MQGRWGWGGEVLVLIWFACQVLVRDRMETVVEGSVIGVTYRRVSAQKAFAWACTACVVTRKGCRKLPISMTLGERIQNSTCSAPDCPETHPAGLVPRLVSARPPSHPPPQPHPNCSSSFLQKPFRACDLQPVPWH